MDLSTLGSPDPPTVAIDLYLEARTTHPGYGPSNRKETYDDERR